MPHVSGDKISSSHTTVIEAAQLLVRELQKDPRINKISLGPIDNRGTGGGKTRLKIIDQDTCVVLAVSGGGSHQDVRVMLHSLETYRQSVKKYIKKVARAEDCEVSFLDRR